VIAAGGRDQSSGTGFVVVVPVKSPGIGKSRLVGLDGVDRRSLAAAFASDTVAACVRTDRVVGVLVVTEDPELAATLSVLGAETCGDGPEPGLNPALRYGAAVAARRWPDAVPVALLADLPALLPADLRAALDQVGGRPAGAASYVADADGTGTTLYAAPYDAFAPRFGAGSAAAHAAAGAVPVEGALPTLRRDVDDVTGLRAALALGVGTATRALLPSPH
jgi:2-phospho-L-lactate guanylyltransferase